MISYPSIFLPYLTSVDQLDIRVIDKPQSADAYTAVGRTIDEQITQIRDLIDIPFRRPDLFCHFREFQ